MTVEEQNVRDLLERFTPYPPTTVSVADVEQRLPMRRVARLATRRRWTPLVAAAAVVVVATAVALTARSEHPTQRPAHPVPSPTLSLDLGPWRATPVLPGQFGQLVSTGSSLLTVDKDRLLNMVPGQGIQASAKLPPNDGGASFAFDGRDVWVAAFRRGDEVVLLRYSYPTLTLQGSVTLHPGRPIARTFVLVGAPGEILVGSGPKVVTVSSTDLSTLGTLTLGADVDGLAWDASDSHLYAAVTRTENSVVEDYVRTRPASYTLRQTVPGAGSPLPRDLVLSDHGLWEIGGLNHYYLKFASFDDLAHPTQVAPPDVGDATVAVDRGTAWIGGTILGCANPDTGQLRAPIQPIVDHTGATSVLADIVSLNGQLYAGYTQYKKSTVLQSGIVKLQPPSACTD